MGAPRIFILSMLVAVVEGECHCMTSCATFPDAPCPSVDDHPCERGWFGPYCQMQNIALDRPTTQSSTYTNDDGTYPSSLAVDGRATNDFASRPFTCTHTEANDKPNWEVDLGGRVNITRIRLYLRNSTVNPGRNDGMKIMVGNRECYQWYERPLVTADVTCGETLQGNRVSISVQSRFLTLCEVQIFSCSVGWFGDECDKQCNCLNDDVCDKLSGHCPGGCTVGFRGTDCLTPCDDHTFGVNCSNVCGNCLNNAVCKKTTGRCPTGCKPGWTGLTCLQPCDDHTFGVNCSNVCGNCLNNAVCDTTTGRCPTRCKPGWTGLTCLQPCVDHTFGVNCGNVCGNCLNNAVCDKTTGRCPTGCKPGWTGLTCLQPCNDGHYGDRCSLRCGHCHNTTVCNKTTGHCPQGICQGKYLAPLCQDYNTDVCVPLAVTVTPYIIIVVIVVVAGVLFVVRKRISFCAKTTSDPEPRYAGFEPKPEADYTEFSFRAHYDSPDAKVYENEEKQAGDDHIYIYPSDDNNR